MQILFRPFVDWGVFEGRTSRSQFWVFYLFWTVVGYFFGTYAYELMFNMDSYGLVRILSVIGGLSFFYILITTLALITRRFHDTGRSAMYLLFILLPFIGNLVIFAFMLFPGQKRTNIYGYDPNGVDDIEQQINDSLEKKELIS